ncbi:hypothetical protein CAEBREN_16927 [Caenorhabditis brenneri]|uniref:Uncharacterized protein n=1 Tax=Caenorhabditis brenneri TaxID=135651 RepID=G0MTC8_CAEBE|nr:hypothetical protein CAEBREN_16927 [Caenorhabditis brenneri]
MSMENLLEEFEVVELKDVEVIEEHAIEKSQNVNEIEEARLKLAKKLKILKENQLEQKLEREQIKRELDELKRSNEEKRKNEERFKNSVEAKLARFDVYEKARRAEFEKYLRRYKERSESSNANERSNTVELPHPSSSKHPDESNKNSTERKEKRIIRRAQSERQCEANLKPVRILKKVVSVKRDQTKPAEVCKEKLELLENKTGKLPEKNREEPIAQVKKIGEHPI